MPQRIYQSYVKPIDFSSWTKFSQAMYGLFVSSWICIKYYFGSGLVFKNIIYRRSCWCNNSKLQVYKYCIISCGSDCRTTDHTKLQKLCFKMRKKVWWVHQKIVYVAYSIAHSRSWPHEDIKITNMALPLSDLVKYHQKVKKY